MPATAPAWNAFRRMAAMLALAAGMLVISAAAQAAEIGIRPWRGPDGPISVITIKGELEEEDEQRFVEVLRGAQDHGLVVLDGPGGSADAAIQIGTAIRDRRFDTLVEDNGVCASACAIIWLGGASRRMEQGARIGFHSIYDRESGRRSASGNAAVAAYMEKLDLNATAIDYATSAPPSGMRWLSLADADYDIKVDVFARPKPHGAKADVKRHGRREASMRPASPNPPSEIPARAGESRRKDA
ncbi:MAG: hypothetical protein J0H63_10810 [Rhizobiales bacterium]|nr:hypothetical protein [Hyphomicrobiales bacterium]MBN9010592.1 hypothetical protein [Hyphomicrobiales bacterium]